MDAILSLNKQTCLCCNKEKSIEAFEHQKNRPNPRKVCKECRYLARDRNKEKLRHSAYQKERRKTHKDHLRQVWERSKYGVCKEDFPSKSCIICGSSERLHIDHCHTTNKVRGLLCSLCNTGLGMFRDNPDLLSKAISYLKDGPHFELK